jgi:hypothetical protein
MRESVSPGARHRTGDRSNNDNEALKSANDSRGNRRQKMASLSPGNNRRCGARYLKVRAGARKNVDEMLVGVENNWPRQS